MKIKKSLLVAPALAVLLLAAAGSVGGTVAWFSSVSTFNTNVSTFGVGRLEGNLDCVVGAGIGTKSAGTNEVELGATESSTDYSVTLTHASFNHIVSNSEPTQVPTLWTIDSATATKTNTTHKIVSTLAAATSDHSKWKANDLGNVRYMYAVTWTMSFTYTFAADTDAQDLYLSSASDIKLSLNGENQAETPDIQDKKSTKYGFRVAFIANGNSTGTVSPLIWAPFYTASRTGTDTVTENSFKYVTGTASTDTAPYTADELLIGEEDLGTVSSPKNDQTKKQGYLGTFTGGSANTGKTLNYTCVAWFEGEDPNIVDGATMQKIAGSFSFYTAKHTGS